MTTTHNHGTTSNTPDVFRTFIGCTVKGLLIGELPNGNMGIARGCQSLIFDCGWALTFSSNGTYWTEQPTEVVRAIGRAKSHLKNAQKELEHVLHLAGEKP